MKYTTQKELVLNHLKKRKRITSWDAIQKYGITRLAHYIYQLKNTHDIRTVTEHGEGRRWAKYVYHGERNA